MLQLSCMFSVIRLYLFLNFFAKPACELRLDSSACCLIYIILTLRRNEKVAPQSVER